MRLLFDEQLSDALPGMLADVFPGSLHVCGPSQGAGFLTIVRGNWSGGWAG